MDDTPTSALAVLLRDWHVWVWGALIAGGLVVFVLRSLAQRRLAFSDYDFKAIAPVYLSLRSSAIGRTPEELGLEPASDPSVAYGVVMDWGMATPGGLKTAVATLTSFSSGDASLYLSTGGGVIGGIGHE